MIRRLLVTTALLTVAGSAIAADLPARSAPASYVAAPVFTWNGFYIGLNAGYANVKTKTTDLDWYDFDATRETNKDAFTGGAQIGYNMQFGAMVLGVEADINAISGDIHEVNRYDSFRTEISYLGTVRARAGVAIDRALVYVTGGLAYGEVKNGWGYYCDHPTSCSYGNGFADTFKSNDTKFGYAVGAGVEYALTGNFSVKFEGIYANLGEDTVKCDPAACGTGSVYRSKFENNVTMLRAGVNYRF